MAWVALVLRLLVGGLFVFSAIAVLVPQLGIAPPEPPAGDAGQFIGLLFASGYLKVVKVLELVGGLLLLSGRLAPLGITLLMPIAVNILLYEIFLLQEPGPGYGLVPLLGVLIGLYWRNFVSVFTVAARAG